MNIINHVFFWWRSFFSLAAKVQKIIWFCVFLKSIPVLAADNFFIETPDEESDASKKERVIEWIHAIHSSKYLGMDDPHLPSFVKFRPTSVKLSQNFSLPRKFLTPDQTLDLRALSAKALKKLPPAHLKSLMRYLATVPVQIKWSDKEGHTQSGKKRKHRASILSAWDKSNAAAALALTMATQGESEIFISIVGLVPEAVLPEFRGHVPALIDAKMMARIIEILLSELDEPSSDASHASLIISYFTHRGFVYWIGKDKSRLNPYLMELLYELNKIVQKGGHSYDERKRGILLGSVLAGASRHIEEIKETDEKRIWIIGLIANLVWAATSFIGMAPIAAPVACAAGGGISVGAVLASSVMTALEYPRDYASLVKQIQGGIEMAILDAVRSKSSSEKIDILLMFKWMSSALHVNGFND